MRVWLVLQGSGAARPLLKGRYATGTETVWQPRRGLSALFEEKHGGGGGANHDMSEVAAFAVNADRLEKHRTIINKKAYGIPFRVSDAAALDNVCRHHGTSVEVHGVTRFLMPFWLTTTAAGGSFKVELLQRDPAFMTQPHALVWMEGPRYDFNYPFGEFLPMNQISASYLEPPAAVEQCLAGDHIPSLLLSRFELLKELEAMPHRPTVVPFTMSTTTALSVVERRVNRRVVLRRIDAELRKFHGSFVRSNVTVTHLHLESTGIRPVFLPMLKLSVSTGSHATPVTALVCGATGRVVGPVLRLPRARRIGVAAAVGAVTLLACAPVVVPSVATAATVAAAAGASYMQQLLRRLWHSHEQAREMAQLQSIGLLNLAADATGYRWTPEEEEKEEYEYREELRRRARARDAFEQRVKEEAARDQAKARGVHFDAKKRYRSDLQDTDPLGYYELLGLKGREMSASAKDVTKAFRDAVRVYHPDVNPTSDPEVQKRLMQRIIEAYKVLHDPKTKKQYDGGELTANAKEAE